MPTGRARGRTAAAKVVLSALALVVLIVALASAAFAAVGSGGLGHASRATGPAPSTVALAVHAEGAQATPQVVATVGVGNEPISAAFDSANGYVYVANVFSDNLTVLDGPSVVGWINLPDALLEGPHFVTYDPLNELVYVLDELNFSTNSGAVTVLSGLSVVTTLDVGPFPTDAVVDPATGDLYVTDFGSDLVSIINAGGTAVLANLTVGSGPISAAYDPADGSVYVANALSDNLSVVSGLTVVQSLGAGSYPVSVAYNPLDQDVYVANNDSANVTVYDGASVIGNVPVGPLPEYAAYNPSVGGVEVTSYTNATVTVINGTTAVAVLGVGAGPVWVGVGPGDPFTYVAASKANAATLLNGLYVAGSTSVGKRPTTGVADPLHDLEFVLNAGSRSVSIFGPAYPITFSETGLAASTGWNVTLGSGTNASTGSSIGFQELPGEYAYSIGTPAGYALVSATPASPLVVSNGSVTVNVVFAPSSPALYNLTFVASGLCSSTGSGASGWHSGGSSSTCCSTSSSAPIGAWSSGGGGGGGSSCCSGSKGNSPLRASVADGYGGNGGGSCCGGGHPSASGNLSWSVTVNGVTQTTTGTTLVFPETDGVYVYTVTAPTGYQVTGSVPASPVTIDGAGVTVNVTFAQVVVLSITFQESGLPGGTTWCVTADNQTECSTSSQIAFTGLSPGTYSFAVSPVNGYTARPASGTVVLSTRSVTVDVTFSSTTHHCM